ncbi:glycoside hydrolase superfamily [Aspergillus desertorum]
MPALLDNAVCGPQVPGTEAPTNGTALADLNPCPLNASCDIWGQCGITAEFCTESESKSGAPGTAAAGENGCISNCGTYIVTSDAPETYRQVAYFEGYNLDRECLYMDASQLDTDTLTHIHFAFGSLTEYFQVGVGNDRSEFEFERFKLLSGASRILSIGGWSFSTDPSTYAIFRNAVQSENVDTATTNIANFITDNGLDGVDIDWENPGAPDIPGIPAGADNEGELYTEFLTQLKSKLSDKTVSIAAPASYWYLRPYEMETLGEILDYIVFMTYDLHGQWDYDNSFASDGCTSGNYLFLLPIPPKLGHPPLDGINMISLQQRRKHVGDGPDPTRQSPRYRL